MARIPLFYTFGNHMHWVDMEWLWGYHVLPGCIRDMLHFCRETGAKGNVNFEGIGYEKLAAEDPEALAELRAAVSEGMVEPVGCSYGQPYGLFHGGESNLRQRVYGARAVRRLLGVWPQTFWEEEFDFFPQLPQMLATAGFRYASLFFQWTWHTPEIPKETEPVIWWEGHDGTRLLCATRNRLNLHQWPEDMELTFSTLAEEAVGDGSTPLILQWLELMPSPDWMCRSEVLLPKMRELLADERFEIRMGTLGEYLSSVATPHDRDAHATFPVRRYSMDQVWHGMSLGKNNDNIRRLSREAEQSLLSAETMAAIGGLMGRPYAQWDVYPTWELEEAWREVLSAQHHDNDECEGLCGHIGRFSYERSLMISSRVGRSGLANLMRRFGEPMSGSVNWGPMKSFIGGLSPAKVDGTPGRVLNEPVPGRTHLMLVNTLGWPVQRSVGPRANKQIVEIPAFGYAFASWQTVKVDPEDLKPKPPVATRTRGDLEFEFDHPSQRILQLKSPEFPEGVFASDGVSPVMTTHAGVEQQATANRYDRDMNGNAVAVGSADKELRVHALFADHCQGVQLSYWGNITRPDPGMKAGYWVEFPLSFRPQILADQPYSINEVQGGGPFLKKYPKGDWMTSPQWFEEIDHSFTALTLLDLVDADNPDRGLLIVHNGNQQWFVDHERQAVRCLITMYDPWDERYFRDDLDSTFLLLPHGPMTNSERWKTAQEWLRPAETSNFESAPREPQPFSALSCDAPNVVMTAFYRETEDYSGKYLENYAGEGMGYPYVVRLVEFDGLETVANLTVSGTVAKAFKTNALGVIEEELSTDGSIGVPMRPYEIATVYLDIVEGRKQTRDLDAKREIWATVHRVEE